MNDTYRAYVAGVGWCWMNDGEVIEVIGASSSVAQREGSSPQGGDTEGGSMRSTPSPTPQGARP